MRKVMLVALAVILFSTQSFAYWHDGYERHEHYHYYHGRYEPILFGAGLVVGALITSLPPRHEVIVVNRSRYIYSDGVYYQEVNGGYLIVEAPMDQTVPPGQNQILVNVPNNDGTYTSVVMDRADNGGWIGPQNEWYAVFPTVAQLKAIYGH